MGISHLVEWNSELDSRQAPDFNSAGGLVKQFGRKETILTQLQMKWIRRVNDVSGSIGGKP